MIDTDAARGANKDNRDAGVGGRGAVVGLKGDLDALILDQDRIGAVIARDDKGVSPRLVGTGRVRHRGCAEENGTEQSGCVSET